MMKELEQCEGCGRKRILSENALCIICENEDMIYPKEELEE